MTQHIVHRHKPKPEVDDAPAGWQRNHVFNHPPEGVTVLHIARQLDATGQLLGGRVRFERGAFVRDVPLQHPQVWERLAGVYLHMGFRLVSDGRTTMVLERTETQ